MLDICTRAPAQMDDMSDGQRSSLMTLARDLERLNASMREAVDAGLSIELERSSRHHHSGGYWGDILTSRVVKKMS